MKSLFLAILPLSAGVVYADTLPPALVWSGTTTFSGGSFTAVGLLPPNILDDPTGLLVEAEENAFTDYTVTTGFTVTAPGDFVFSSSADYSTVANICLPTSCSQNPNSSNPGFNASFSGTIEILDSGNNQVFSELLSDSGSMPYNCNPVYCSAFLYLSDSDFRIVDLPIGNYTLEVNYSDSEDSPGPSGGSNEVEANLVPTPEPHELALLISGLAVIFLAKARIFRR
jgi:hypothetical protein